MSEVVESPNVVVIPADQPLIPTTEEPKTEVKEEVVPEQKAEQEETDQERDEKGRFKPNRVQERIDELTKRAGEKEREAAYWRGIAEQAQKPADKAPEADPSKPKPDQYPSYDEYVEALTDWKTEKKLAERESKAEGAKRTETWNQRMEAAKAKLADFDTVLSQSTAPMSQAMAESLREMDRGPEVVYHLAQNPAEAERIARLSPMAAARELGKLEASLTQAPKSEPAPKRVTQAPAPTTPVGGSRSTEGDPSKMSMSEYRAWRQAKLSH